MNWKIGLENQIWKKSDSQSEEYENIGKLDQMKKMKKAVHP